MPCLILSISFRSDRRHEWAGANNNLSHGLFFFAAVSASSASAGTVLYILLSADGAYWMKKAADGRSSKC